jgi:hypothetical protein
LRKGESPVLPGEEREEELDGKVGAGGVRWQREWAFLFKVPLKLTLSHRRADPGGSHPIMSKWGGAWAVPCQVQVVWPSPGNLHEPQTFPTSSVTQRDITRSDVM